MSDIDHARVAPLVRGLFLGELGRPAVVVPGSEPTSGAGDALELEVPESAVSAAAAPANDERAFGAALREALGAWRSSRGAQTSLPGCVVLKRGSGRVAYYAGRSIDEARTRAGAGDASVLQADAHAQRSAADAARPGGDASAAGRAQVVEARIAIVTGGAQGFGEEIASALAASGALVFVADLNFEGARRLSESLCAEWGRTCALPVAVNVADEASVSEMFAEVARTAGGLDLVVSNAGVLKASSVLEQDAGAFRFVTDVNYVGFYLVTKHAGLLFRRQRYTAPRWRTDIIQINSKSGLEGSNRNGAYAGSKFGGIGLVQSYALELVEYGIKVNAICPGNFFDGPLWSNPENGLFVQYLRSGKVPGARTVADVKAFYEAKVPMGRGCEGRDVMRAIYYIVEQEYETGQALPVTGGQVMLS